MEDWVGYRSDLTKIFGAMEQLGPNTLKGVQVLTDPGAKVDLLGPKMRELIALAVAVTTRCDGCISFHADLARKAGATKDELMEALGVAVALNAGAALVYSARAMDAFTSG